MTQTRAQLYVDNFFGKMMTLLHTARMSEIDICRILNVLSMRCQGDAIPFPPELAALPEFCAREFFLMDYDGNIIDVARPLLLRTIGNCFAEPQPAALAA